MENHKVEKKEEIIICLLYDYNEQNYINSPQDPVELHNIFLTKALKTLEQNDGCFIYRNFAEENTFIWENVSDDFALYDRMQKDMFKSTTKKVSKSHLFLLSIEYLYSAYPGPAIILECFTNGTHSISQDAGRKQMAHSNWIS